MDRFVQLAKSTVEGMAMPDCKEASSARAAGHEPIGVLIHDARVRRGLSQYGLADLLVALSGKDSLTRAEVARWERGRRIPGPFWRQWLAVALEFAPEQLAAAARTARWCRRRSSAQSLAARVRP